MSEANKRGTFEERKRFREEARAAREWRLNTPIPKNFPALIFDEPYLSLTDELFSQLVNSGKFDRMPKKDFDYLRSQNFYYDTVNNTFTSSKNTAPKKDSQVFDLYKDFSKGEALVKTCKLFHTPPSDYRPFWGQSELDTDSEKSNTFQREFEASGASSIKEFLEYDEILAKKQQKRIKKTIKAAKNFSFLKEYQDLKNGNKSININYLKLVDFNGTDFKKVTSIPDGMKISDFLWTDFTQVRALDTKTGEMFTFFVQGKGNKRHYILQSSRSKLEDRLSMRKVMAKLLPEYRVSKCGCCVQSNTQQLSVFKSRAHNTVSLSNLQSDSSVWHCAVCAAKITERRRVEMNRGVFIFKTEHGGSTTFATRTVPHTKSDALLSLRDRFRLADKLLKKPTRYRKMRARFGIFGDIKATELTVTWANGWHLHIHEIFFHNADAFEGAALESNPAYVAFLKDFEQAYYEQWRDAAVNAGFDEPSRAHGLQVQNGDFAAEYIAKWGREPESKWDAAAELSKAHIKNSRKGYTPWALIRLYRDTGDERFVPLIQEYAHTMHGVNQLRWSNGLKKALGMDELDDEEIAEKMEDDAEEIGVLSPVQWKFIVKNDLDADFFTLAAQGWDVVTAFLHSYENYPKIFSLEAPPDIPPEVISKNS